MHTLHPRVILITSRDKESEFIFFWKRSCHTESLFRTLRELIKLLFYSLLDVAKRKNYE